MLKSRFAQCLAGGGLLLLLVAFAPQNSRGQAGAPADLSKLVEDVAAQQATLLQNQAAIDTKLASVGEEVRQARLFVARGGGRK